ncbi:MAG: TPR end-of-group domain-containing protein [Pyrinomonadaceae bacterium]
MKRCPECRRDYYDDSLLYCLDDGTALLDGPATGGTDGAVTAILRDSVDAPEQTATRILGQDTATVLSPLSNGRVLVIILGLAVLTTGAYFTYRHFSSERQIRSIAVMPFVNTSGDPQLEYLTDGMTDSLINSLSELSQLSVKGRSYVFRYKGKDVDPQAVASELSVQAVLNGRIVQKGDAITISLDLVDARTGDQAWGDQYTRPLGDLSALQADIARDVSQKLLARLTGAEQTKLNKPISKNSEAYQLYLQGRYEWNKRTGPTTAKAIVFFQQAIEKDPSYAKAYVGLAEAYFISFASPPKERSEKARSAALKAIELDPTLGEPHATIANYKAALDWDYAGAEQEYKRAIELSPGYPTGYHWYGEFLVFQGRFDEGLATYRKAIEIEPYSLAIGSDYGIAQYYARRYDDSVTYLKKLIDQDPNYVRNHKYLSQVYEKLGRYEDALNERAKAAIARGVPADEIAKDLPRGLRAIKADGAKGYWSFLLSDMMQDARHSGTNREDADSADVAEIYSHLGQKDKAFELLDKSIAATGEYPGEIKVSPAWDDLRDDPRFDDLLRKLKLL